MRINYGVFGRRRERGVVTPRTIPVGKMMPKARIWMMIWIHNVASYVKRQRSVTVEAFQGRMAPYKGIWRDSLAFWYLVIVMLV